MQRLFKVVFEFLTEDGYWKPDCFNRGYNFMEADMIAAQLRQSDRTRNVRVEPVNPVV